MISGISGTFVKTRLPSARLNVLGLFGLSDCINTLNELPSVLPVSFKMYKPTSREHSA